MSLYKLFDIPLIFIPESVQDLLVFIQRSFHDLRVLKSHISGIVIAEELSMDIVKSMLQDFGMLFDERSFITPYYFPYFIIYNI